jgi:hypothetical protein
MTQDMELFEKISMREKVKKECFSLILTAQSPK